MGYAGRVTELEKGPRGLRRGRGARERILSASQQLFRDQGINGTGMDQLCAVAEVSKRTLYQHFPGKDPFIAAAVEIPDPGHPARVHARNYKKGFAARLTDTAREAGATNPEQLGEQLALLLDGASARSRVLNTEAFTTAAAIAAVLVDNAIPTAAAPAGASAVEQHGQDDDDAGRGGAPRSGRGAVAEHPGQGHILDRITEQM